MRRVVFILSLVIVACQPQPRETFFHEVDSEQKPWKHARFDHADEKFSFVIFSDLTGGEREGVFSVAVEQMNLLRPELIVNVGDLVEGGGQDPGEWKRQWDAFDTRANRALAPIFYMGGNHDLTGKMAREIWKERLGPRYYHFLYRDVLFLVFDTEDYSTDRMAEIEEIRQEGIEIFNSGGHEAFSESAYAKLPERSSGFISREQSAYFLDVIDNNPDVRWTFILIHKPAWEREDEKHFAMVEEALAGQPYTVFYGHTHVYKYEQRLGMDYINLATTGGVQFPERGRSMDHLVWVTVDDQGVTMANLLMQGILDKRLHIPLGGDSLEFEKSLP